MDGRAVGLPAAWVAAYQRINADGTDRPRVGGFAGTLRPSEQEALQVAVADNIDAIDALLHPDWFAEDGTR